MFPAIPEQERSVTQMKEKTFIMAAASIVLFFNLLSELPAFEQISSFSIDLKDFNGKLPKFPATSPCQIYFEPWQIDFDTFQEAQKSLNSTPPDFEAAIRRFDELISKFPDARDLDYAYGWKTYCLAKLGKFKEALASYKIIREKFYGYVLGGASGALRLWDDKLGEVKSIIRSASSPEALETVAEMEKLDFEAEKKFGKPKAPGE